MIDTAALTTIVSALAGLILAIAALVRAVRGAAPENSADEHVETPLHP